MENQTKMFWGLVLENGKQYKQTSKFNFHVSRAVLDLKSCDDSEQVGVYVQVDNTDYLLCNLNKKDSTQSSLDLMFCEGEKIKFYATGKASIHLTGYILPDDEIDDAFMDEDSELSDEELSIEDDLANKANNKRKNTETLKLGENAKKIKGQPENAKKIIDVDTKQLVKKEQPKKNVPAKPAAKKAEDDSDDDDLSIDEDEESVDINDLMNMESDDDELDSNDEDLESDDEDDDLKKLKDVKNKVKFANGQNKQNQKNKPNGSFNKPQNKSPQQNKNMQQNKNQQNTPHNKNQQNTPQNKNQQNTPQNKNQQNTPQNKSQQKHQQTPFHNKNQKNSGKKGTPFNKNKTPGSQNKEENGDVVLNNNLTQNQSNSEPKKNKNIKKLSNGLIIEDIVSGEGPEAKKGKFCQMNYVGKLANNKVFDKSGKKPFSFRLGLGEVIKGWDLGVQGMKVGGKRRLVIPSTLAYGNSGVGQIPPNATLCFDVELKNVN